MPVEQPTSKSAKILYLPIGVTSSVLGGLMVAGSEGGRATTFANVALVDDVDFRAYTEPVWYPVRATWA